MRRRLTAGAGVLTLLGFAAVISVGALAVFTDPGDNFDGTPLSSGDPDDGVGGKLVGDSAQGAQAGDRTLGVGASERLCFRVGLPAATPGGVKSAATTATLAFGAEQTANNP